MKPLFILLMLTILSACSSNTSDENSTPSEVDKAQKTWALYPKESQLSFISTKNKNIKEEHTFSQLSGHIDTNNKLYINVPLESIETNIEIRNQRMKEHLFHTEKFPDLIITTTIEPEKIAQGLNEITVNVSMHNHNKTYTAKIMVDQNSQRIIATSYEPIIVNAKDFALDEGINKLTSLAQLQSISYTVPVEFKLVFLNAR